MPSVAADMPVRALKFSMKKSAYLKYTKSPIEAVQERAVKIFLRYFFSRYFSITVLFYNPNIYPPEEYEHRVNEARRLVGEMPFVHPVKFMAAAYDPDSFYGAVRGLEKEPEGGKRCEKCYALRLSETARRAKEGGFDYFATTLSISPLKSAAKLNEAGEKAAAEFGVRHLPSDFKKRDGYRRSLELSREYGLYRQNYCGCIYSIRT